MNSFVIYSIQSSLSLLLFYLIYWLLLKKETYYFANRVFLLSSVLLSILLPFFPLQYTVFIENGLAETSLFNEIGQAFKEIQPYTGSGFKAYKSFGFTDALLIIYLIGLAIFMLRLIIQTSSLVIELYSSKRETIHGLYIVESKKYDLPFSFFNVVFINPKYNNQNVLPDILAHETVHIREKHWVDLLIIELLTVVFWFNPIIWFFEHSIKLNHEFLADNGVISKGIHLGRYQALLINQLMGVQVIGITNNLNYSINSNRLKMMTKQKTPKIKAVKMVWALPVIALMLFAFAKPNYQISQEQNSKNTIGISAPQQVTLLSGKIVDEKGDALSGVSIVIEGTSQGTVSDREGNFKIGLAKNSNLLLSYVGKKTLHFSAKELFLKASDRISIEIKMEDAAILLSPKMLASEITEPSPVLKTEDLPPPPPKLDETKNPPPPPPSIKGNKEKEVFFVVEELPQYPGGYSALGSYINKMQEQLAKEKGVSGTAKLSFTINKNGEATAIRILEKDNELAAKGAASIIMNMDKWSPGKQRGKAVEVTFILPCTF
ncbi:MAG: carboxypeptidase-like regulatory domain-containing protein [Bacteroidales bacterium]|nr:carboxypeptidase-like regulatory domain-containing protein [Bacteroidales bacterium]